MQLSVPISIHDNCETPGYRCPTRVHHEILNENWRTNTDVWCPIGQCFSVLAFRNFSVDCSYCGKPLL